MINKIMVAFVLAEFVIGTGFTIWFIMKNIIFPVIDFVLDYWSSYHKFIEWRKRNAD